MSYIYVLTGLLTHVPLRCTGPLRSQRHRRMVHRMHPLDTPHPLPTASIPPPSPPLSPPPPPPLVVVVVVVMVVVVVVVVPPPTPPMVEFRPSGSTAPLKQRRTAVAYRAFPLQQIRAARLQQDRSAACWEAALPQQNRGASASRCAARLHLINSHNLR